MDRVNLQKEVLNSNLSDEAKIEILKLFLGQDAVTINRPYQITQPVIIKEVPVRPLWDEWTVTCASSPRNWWEQQQLNAQADVEAIIHPIASL